MKKLSVIFGFLSLAFLSSATNATAITDADNMLRLPEHTQLRVVRDFALSNGKFTWFVGGRVLSLPNRANPREPACYLVHSEKLKRGMRRGDIVELGYDVDTAYWYGEAYQKISVSGPTFVSKIVCMIPPDTGRTRQLSVGDMKALLAPWFSVEFPR